MEPSVASNTMDTVDSMDSTEVKTSIKPRKLSNHRSKGAPTVLGKYDNSKGKEVFKTKGLTGSKKFKNGKDVIRGRNKFSTSPRGKKSKSGKLTNLLAVNADPLNLAALIGKGGSDSPQNSPPVVERAHHFEPRGVLPTDMSDPLQLNTSADDGSAKTTPRKRKKRKRRHTYHGEADPNISTDYVDVSMEKEVEDKEDKELNDVDSVNDVEEEVETDDVFPNEGKEVKKINQEDADVKSVPVSKKRKSNEKKEFLSPKSLDKAERKVQEETTVEENKTTSPEKKLSNYRLKDQKFKYGNYNRYYGYRNPNMSEDSRISLIQREWIVEKDCLDIGCNVGHVTLWVARHMHPKAMVGVDIDGGLVRAARNNIRHYLPTRVADTPCQSEFPISFALCQGPLAAPVCTMKGSEVYGFPYNVTFHEENYVPLSDDELKQIEPKYDTILCLSVTKWVQLNWGDNGLKRMFKKVFLHLRPGGRFVLEPQPFKSYKKKKNLTAEIRQNYDSIKLHPDKFIPYLLSKEVGFATSEALDSSHQKARGFHRAIFVLTKSKGSASKGSKEERS